MINMYARDLLGGVAPDIDAALDALAAVANALTVSHREVAIYFDLTELRGYHYHTGLVFAAYMPGVRAELAKGGRYDRVGEAFGRARAATGFSTDLKTLLACDGASAASALILAPAGDDPVLRGAIGALRATGERVRQALPGETVDAAALGCMRELRLVEGKWTVVNL